ncbi:MAG: phosphatase PAP2 family protein [Actinomycetes bacterium]
MNSSFAQTRRLSDTRRELLVAGLAYLAYEVARLWAVGDTGTALATGRAILEAEELVGLDVEAGLNAAFGAIPLVAVASCYFYALCHYLVTPIVLVWLFRTDRVTYRRGRTALLVATAAGFLGHWLLPTAPPRMLPGFDDTMATWAAWGWWGGSGGVPSGMEGLANPVAAMPSLHVGWAVWCGWYLFRVSKRPVVRAVGVVYPIATTVVVVGTANHYLLDAVAGAAVIAFGAAVAGASEWIRPGLLRPGTAAHVPHVPAQRPSEDEVAVPEQARPTYADTPPPAPPPASPPIPRQRGRDQDGAAA